MKRSAEWSYQSILYLTAALLFASALLRSVLLFRDHPAFSTVLALFAAWAFLFAAETTIAYTRPRAVARFFPVYLFCQVVITLALLLQPLSSDHIAALFSILSMQTVQRWNTRLAAVTVGLFWVMIAPPLVINFGAVNGLVYSFVYAGANVLLAFYARATRRAQAARAQNQAYAAQLQDTNRALQTYAGQLERLAAARERQRLARELHDSVTQTIFSMTLTTQSAALLLERDPPRADEQLARLDALAQSALAEMRVLIAELTRPQVGTLAARLRAHLRERALLEGLAIALDVQGAQPLSAAEESGLFRIAQEAVNNIVKHARAAHACIRLHLAEPYWMQVEDDGCGFVLNDVRDGRRVGLAGMRERAAEIGWDLQIESRPGAGTRVRVDKPAGERRTDGG